MDSAHELLTWIEENTTQAQFARDVEISEAHLCDILAGRKSPSLDLAVKMSKATGSVVSVEAIHARAPSRAKRRAASETVGAGQ